MFAAAASLLLAASSADAALVVDKLVDRITAHTVGRVVDLVAGDRLAVRVRANENPDDEDTGDDEADEDVKLEVTPPVPPAPPQPPEPPRAPIPPRPPQPPRILRFDRNALRMEFHGGDPDSGATFTEKGRNVPTVDLLHRIANEAGWSMTLVGSPKEAVDIDVKEVPPREALRHVLRQSGAMGVLKGNKLVVVASPESSSAGLLVEETTGRKDRMLTGPGLPPAPPNSRRGGKRSKNDVVRFFSDVTIQQGQIVQGDVVCVGCDVELEPGAVVRGDVVAVKGSVVLSQGALVLGEAVAVLGDVDIARGAQVMGEHVQVGFGRLWPGSRSGSSILNLGPFGLFPSIAFFALVYLFALLALRMWPDRVRLVGNALFENPVRSFSVGFLCWLLVFPGILLLLISVVGIPLIPLLPVGIFLSIVLGLASLALRIGESLPAGPGQRFVPPAALGMGMLVLLLIGLVPWLGVSLLALVQFFALGAAVGSRFGRALPPHG